MQIYNNNNNNNNNNYYYYYYYMTQVITFKICFAKNLKKLGIRDRGFSSRPEERYFQNKYERKITVVFIRKFIVAKDRNYRQSQTEGTRFEELRSNGVWRNLIASFT